MIRHIVIGLMGVLSMALGSCKKQLDALPNDALVEGNTITSEQTAKIALNGAYYLLADATALKTNWLGEEINGSILAGYMDDGNYALDETKNVLGNSTMTSDWGMDYKLVNAANGVIEGVEGLGGSHITDSSKQQLLGEARFLRAYANFKLLLWFGQWFDASSKYGIILRTQFITSTNYPQDRAGVQASYDSILSDVNYAIVNAPVTSRNTNANRWTAMALKMRVLLSHGQMADYTECAALGNSIISGSPYTLEGSEQDIFYTKGLGSNEVMLGIQPQAAQGDYYYNTSGNYVGQNDFYVATTAFQDLLAGDPRSAWILGDPAPYKGINFIKYIQPARQTTQLSEVAYAFRLTEVYLMEAEAIVRSGGDLAQARQLVQTVMAHAGVTDFSALNAATTSDDLLEQIYYEYVKNFVGEEGQPYWALLRFPLATVTQMRPTITSTNQYILPIPADEFITNPKIGDQNPGYVK